MHSYYTLGQLAALRRDDLIAEASRTRRARAARTGRSTPPGTRRVRDADRPGPVSVDD
jgi:hypothetical protein